MSDKWPLRRSTRIDVALDARLTTSDNVTFAVLIRDISAAGFRVEALTGEELLVGETIKIQVPGEQQLTGQIKWTAGRTAGGVFSA